MAILRIPVENVSRQTMTVRLGGQDIRLTIWRQPRGGWYFTAEVGQEAIAGGKRMQPNVQLLGPVNGVAGFLLCLPLRAGNVNGLGEEPWGRSHRLLWIDDNSDG